MKTSQTSYDTALIVLTESNLENEDGQTNDKECHKVGDEERSSSIILEDTSAIDILNEKPRIEKFELTAAKAGNLQTFPNPTRWQAVI
jgi:hypothetical protein